MTDEFTKNRKDAVAESSGNAAAQVTLAWPIGLLIAAAAVFLAQPVFIKVVLQLTGPHSSGLSAQLGAENIAANVSGACDAISGVLALLGSALLVRRFIRKRSLGSDK